MPCWLTSATLEQQPNCKHLTASAVNARISFGTVSNDEGKLCNIQYSAQKTYGLAVSHHVSLKSQSRLKGKVRSRGDHAMPLKALYIPSRYQYRSARTGVVFAKANKTGSSVEPATCHGISRPPRVRSSQYQLFLLSLHSICCISQV